VTSVRFTVQMLAKSEANARGHWAKKAARAKKQREHVLMQALQEGHLHSVPGIDGGWRVRGIAFPARVLLVRVAPCPLDDDNLRPALKAVRDEVAALLGLKIQGGQNTHKRIADDRDPRVTWDYAAENGSAAVRIEITFGADEVAA
jgi:hypothetical protein